MSTHSERNVSTDSERNAIRSTEDAARLRVTFDEDAERYDRARPGYPRPCSTTSTRT